MPTAAAVKDQGFLLRRIPYSESSFILKVFTREHGLLSFMAKGAKKQNSRLHGLLEPVIHLQFLFPGHSRGELRILSDVALARDFPEVRDDIVKHRLAQAFGEVLLRYTPDEAAAPEFHDLLLEATARLERAPATRSALRAEFARFLLGYCDHSGWRPRFTRCARCGGEVSGERVAFQLEQGGPTCGRCLRADAAAPWFDAEVLRWLDAVQRGGDDPQALDKLGAARAEEFLLAYLGRHAGAQKPLKALSVWHALMDG